MKTITIILITTLISCSPFISKDLRRKNKCNRKLARLTKSCPELLQTDTIKDTIVFQVPKIEIDTFIQLKKDTTILETIKNDTIRKILRKYINNYVPFKDTITQKIDGYTFLFWVNGNKLQYSVKKPLEVVIKTNDVKVKVVQPIKLTWEDKAMNLLNKFWWWIFLFVVGLLFVKFLTKIC